MKRLSRYRRHRAAAPMLLVLALLSIGTTFSVASATPSKSELVLARSAMIEEGKELFLKGCSSCHGLNAEGGAIAPSLIGVGAASVDFQVATGRMPMADMSTQAMRKDPVYSPEEVAALAAYVASLAPGPAIPGESELNFERDGSTAEGGELFRNNCAMCHNAVGAGGALTEGKYAPALSETAPKHVYQAMVTGPQNMPVFNDANLTPEDKRDIIAYLKYVEEAESVGGYELASIGPVAEGLFVWIFGLGFIIAITVWLGAKAN